MIRGLSLLLTIGALQGAVAAERQPNDLSVPLPSPSAVSMPLFTCHEVLSSSITTERGQPPLLQAAVRRGGEVFHMRLIGNTLNLMTKAEASIGEAEGHPMTVLSSEAGVVVATGSDSPGSSMSFVLQRKSGFALWTRTRATTWLGHNAPEIQAVYFACK